MSRVRSFAAPHKGLRNVLSQFSLALGQADFADPPSLQNLKKLGAEMFLLLNDHVRTENNHTLRHLEQRAPGSSAHDRDDHERLEKIQDLLEEQLSAFVGKESPEAVHRYYLEFTRFHSEYLTHIYEEETVTELLLQKHFTDEELIQHRIDIMKKLDFATLMLWLKYIVPSQQESESVGMLRGLKAGVAEDSFAKVLELLRTVLGEERFRRLNEKLQ